MRTTHIAREGRMTWIQIAAGAVQVNGQQLDAGDGLGIRAPGLLQFTGVSTSEVLLFDMPA